MFFNVFCLNALSAILRGGLRFCQQPSTDNHLYLSRLITHATSQCVDENILCANLISPEALVDRICWSVNQKSLGVKVLWAPKGSGKTVATRLAAQKLIKHNLFSGRIAVAASELDLASGTPLLRQLCSRWGAEWGGQLSELFSRKGKPVLLLIDQIDNFMMSDEGLRRTQTLVKTLAEDSVLNGNFVVLAVCSNLNAAKALLDANGRQKIVLVSPTVSQYKWKRHSLEDLLNSAKKSFADVGDIASNIREELLSSAALAGTPGFLLRHLDSLTDAGSLKVMKTRLKAMRTEARDVADLWHRGEVSLEDAPKYD